MQHHYRTVLAALVAGLLAATCSSPKPAPPTAKQVPLVIGHRSLPDLYPEETQPAEEAATDQGADSLEADLHLSKDRALVARHDPWLSDNTSIAEVAKTNAAVAGREGQGWLAHHGRQRAAGIPRRPDRSGRP